MGYFEEANESYNNRNYKKALELYKKSIDLNENEPSSLYNSAVCFIKLKEYNKAIPLLKKAIAKRKESTYFFNLGYCYTMLNDKKKGLIYFNLAWCLNKNDKDCERAINIILKNYKKSI